MNHIEFLRIIVSTFNLKRIKYIFYEFTVIELYM